MRIYLTAAILLALLAGCSSDQNSPDGKTATVAGTALQGKAALPFAARSAMSSFASLPDRGELLAYEQGRKTKRSGAYTAYPVGISEMHALHAMQDGEMVVKAPNGELVRLKYERHEESPDGNWTWIGRDAKGNDAVITFGEKAVFGSIPQGDGETLRLTMSAGQSWLVQTDRSKLAGLDGAKGREGGDQFIPPKLSTAAGLPTVASMQAQSANTTAGATAASSVIDVLLGYTNGFASKLGSDSAAVTRLNNMVAITNQAYQNSGVNMRARLVKVVKVNYADNTDNGDALEKLTGYEAGEDGGSIPTDPAFNELRAARDESGADLVSLVRAFSTPENNGCGIAWLIGGDGAGITAADAPFGYSVVSDGTDLDEDDDFTYYCRDETLAHELGHNMGQAHNEEDSDSTGVHAYSYGYREASSTGFYTVMAYPQADGNQSGIRYFANPSIKFDGRATGVADQSDNVRSMNQTMPIVSAFRATVVPVAQVARNDFDGDGKADILWRSSSSGSNVIWRAASSTTTQAVTRLFGSAWTVAGVADFNGDGRADILWRNVTTGYNTIWRSASSTTGQAVSERVGQTWQVAGTGDFDGDGKADILWRNTATGVNEIWRSANSSTPQAVTSLSGAGWIVAAVEDFNGDGKADILWRNTVTGYNTIWRSANSATGQAMTGVGGQDWTIVGVGDFTGDGQADVLWRSGSSGSNVIWRSANSGALQSVTRLFGSVWTVAGIADFNDDGRADILWRHTGSGYNTIWLSANSTTGQAVTGVGGQDWRIQGFK